MSRTRSVATATLRDRRAFLAATGAVSLSAGIGLALRPGIGEAAAHTATTQGRPLAVSRPAPAAPLAPYTRGTTLSAVAAPRSGSGYRRLGDGPAWPRVVRGDLAAPKAGRAERRTALAAFVQFTDLHLVDVQHPLRYEYLRAETASAWRPQESLPVPGAVSLVERVNALRGAPVTGAPLHFVMTTGDNTDNNAKTELDWFLKVMSGGRITPNSGDPNRYEGVQNSDLKLYWQPDAALRDADKQLGFPRIEGFLAAAIRELRSPGLNLPWYSTVGNHDSLPGGCYAPGDSFFADFAVGGKKLMTLTESIGAAIWKNVKKGRDPKGARIQGHPQVPGPEDAFGHPGRGPRPLHPRRVPPGAPRPRAHGPRPRRTRLLTGEPRREAPSTTPSASPTTCSASASTPPTRAATTRARSAPPSSGGWSATLRAAEKNKEHVVVFSHHTSKSMRNLRERPGPPGRTAARRRRGRSPSSAATARCWPG